MKMLIVGVSIGLLAGIGYAMPDAKEQKAADAKVLTFPVELTPGKSYGMSLNSMSHKNFKSAAGVVMEPYPYAFRVAR